ncbi:MAG TPA: nucleoid-associated protein, partial [Terrisporobacter glycolicus]
EYLEEKELYKDFNIDKKVVEKSLKNRTVKTDSGFKISANLVYFEDPMKYSLRQNEDGTCDIVIKNVGYIEG